MREDCRKASRTSLAYRSCQFDIPVVQMGKRFGYFHRHGDDIEIGIDSLGVGALMAWNGRFGYQ